LFFAIMVLGIPLAYHRREAFDAVFLLYLSNMLFFLVFVSEVNSSQRLMSFMLIICLSNIVYGFFGGMYGSSFGGRLKVSGTTFDPNDIAYVLVSLLPLCFFYLRINAGLFRRLLGIFAICSSLVVILLTGSRGGFVGLTAVLAMMLLTKTGSLKASQKIFLLVLMGGVYFTIAEKVDMARYMTVTDIESDYNMTSPTGRVEIWKRAIGIALDHPLTGVGVNSFPRAIGQLRTDLREQPRWQVAHNSYLQIAAEVGLIGFFVFVLINVQTLLSFLHASRIEPASSEAREIRTLGSLMLLGFVGHTITAFFITQSYSVYFTLYFALGTVMRRLHFDLTESRQSLDRSANDGRRPKAPWVSSLNSTRLKS
ncbi:MAG: O-antigen ligase family protein, partial [Nitrososphaera sp.]|nr:O-antigen ligase family protein [Nitrososphaera sp.]